MIKSVVFGKYKKKNSPASETEGNVLKINYYFPWVSGTEIMGHVGFPALYLKASIPMSNAAVDTFQLIAHDSCVWPHPGGNLYPK